MGYESRLYVVDEYGGFKVECADGVMRPYASTLATMNLACCGSLWSDTPAKCVISNDEGEELITDRYGKLLTSSTVEETIEKLKQIVEEDDYRRAKYALAILQEFKRQIDNGEWEGEEIRVYHYGY